MLFMLCIQNHAKIYFAWVSLFFFVFSVCDWMHGVLTGNTIRCGLPVRRCSRICKLSIVYANLVLARTLTFYCLAPRQQPNMALGFGVCLTAMSVKNCNSLLRQRSIIVNILKHVCFIILNLPSVSSLFTQWRNKMKVIVIFRARFLL